jgi:hypothetical protein
MLPILFRIDRTSPWFEGMSLIWYMPIWFMIAFILYDCVMPSLTYAIIFGAIFTPIVVLIGQLLAG